MDRSEMEEFADGVASTVRRELELAVDLLCAHGVSKDRMLHFSRDDGMHQIIVDGDPAFVLSVVEVSFADGEITCSIEEQWIGAFHSLSENLQPHEDVHLGQLGDPSTRRTS